MVETVTGTNRSAGLSVQELMAYDTHPVPEYLSRESPMPPGPTLVPAERYHSRDFHEREMEQLSTHGWQMACHEDDLPGVGDYVPYEIGELSFLIVRSAPAPSPASQRPPLTRCSASAACANSTGERTRLFPKAIITRMRSVASANVVAVTHTCG